MGCFLSMKLHGRTPVLPDYNEAGNGPTIIFIPGMEGHKEFWRFQQAALSTSYRTIAVSLVCRSTSSGARVADYAADIILLMDRLEIEKAVIVGESFGGMVTQELATSHPDRVAAIALCNTMDKPRFDHFGLNIFTLASFVHMLAFAMPMGTRRPMLRWVGRHRGFVMDPTPGNEALIDYLLAYGTVHGLRASFNRIIAASKMRYLDRLKELRIPSLILRGTEDRVVSLKTMERMRDAIPGATMALIVGGGHCCQITMPDETNKALREWLATIGV